MTGILSRTAAHRLRKRFRRLYGEAAPVCMERLAWLLRRFPPVADDRRKAPLWDERDTVLITYGDAVRREGEPPLRTLHRLLRERLAEAIGSVHLLPFCPWSSDDGFSVIDYREVDPALGRWRDIEAIGGDFTLMFDLVLNHVSRQSAWFRDYVNGIAPGRRYFHEVQAETDLSAVVRPRSLPLLSAVNARQGRRWLWTTFSDDQIDLNFANPDVLFEFLEIILLYVAKGVRILRLDAIAFLWKEIGTDCMHRPETHEVVRLLRDVLDAAAPGTLLLTETNVPHAENLSYFGKGDEAHLVYQFSLPPLVLHALHAGQAARLTAWAAGLAPPPPGCTFLNFTASHDGIGVRPLQGLLDETEMATLIDRVKRCGGQVSTRRLADGSDVPYELNIGYFDALGDPDAPDDPLKVARFLCAQAIPLAMPGIPAVYLHSLTATPNDLAGVAATGRARSINRHKWDEAELLTRLDDSATSNARVFRELARMLRIRRAHPAFHPEAAFRVPAWDEGVFAVIRTVADGRRLLALHNVSAAGIELDLAGEMGDGIGWHDLLAPEEAIAGSRISLAPLQVRWLADAMPEGA